MNSKKLHRYERWYFFSIYILFIFILLKIVAFVVRSLELSVWSNLGAFMSMLAICITTICIYCKSYKWRREGKRLTEEIGLESIIIVPGNFLNRNNVLEYEIHHKTDKVRNGLAKRMRKKSEVIEELNNSLQEDYQKLAEWRMKKKKETPSVDIMFHTTTHPAMIHIWRKNSKDYFYVKQMDQVLDPYAKMNWIQWLPVSFATTGYIGKRPKEWGSYYFYSNCLGDKEDDIREGEEKPSQVS
ncbi:hypothetical protein ACH0BF_16805 [Pseudobacillus sp. 179-B 2D1 NHS]|uniref:hypothetical protein n=1 Tax=Pseudobacillus sp. 179-B 2D1 NHS TaxID=3374292 RepID=UPI00387A5CCC